MRRQNKYPDTNSFHYLNVNPKNRLTGDCTYRAIATALDKPWKDVVMEMAMSACENGYSPASKENIDRYLQSQGWVKQKQPRKFDNTKYTGTEWCDELYHRANPEETSIVAMIGGHHVVCIKEMQCDDGIYRFKIHDTWNSSYKCIGNYWVKLKKNN